MQFQAPFLDHALCLKALWAFSRPYPMVLLLFVLHTLLQDLFHTWAQRKHE